MSDREVTAHTIYEWDCNCGNVNYAGDMNPDGTEVQCDDCGETSYCTETR